MIRTIVKNKVSLRYFVVVDFNLISITNHMWLFIIRTNTVFRNLKNFHLEVNVEEFSQIHNTTEKEGIKYIFTKTLDILLDKDSLEQVSFTIIISNMELITFEMFIDSITTFLTKYEDEIALGHVSLLLKYEAEYEEFEKDKRRWEKAWTYLTG